MTGSWWDFAWIATGGRRWRRPAGRKIGPMGSGQPFAGPGGKTVPQTHPAGDGLAVVDGAAVRWSGGAAQRGAFRPRSAAGSAGCRGGPKPLRVCAKITSGFGGNAAWPDARILDFPNLLRMSQVSCGGFTIKDSTERGAGAGVKQGTEIRAGAWVPGLRRASLGVRRAHPPGGAVTDEQRRRWPSPVPPRRAGALLASGFVAPQSQSEGYVPSSRLARSQNRLQQNPKLFLHRP